MEGHNVYKGESLFVCLVVLYTSQHCCIYINQIWQNGKEPPWGGFRYLKTYTVSSPR